MASLSSASSLIGNITTRSQSIETNTNMTFKSRTTNKDYKLAFSHTSSRRNIECLGFNKISHNKVKYNFISRKFPLETILE
jgi:hypothetical protein